MPLDRIVGNLFQRTSSPQRAAFLACFCFGLFGAPVCVYQYHSELRWTEPGV